MSEKISTLVLKVDLDCPQCCKKIKKILCGFSCIIRSTVIEKKKNTVTISGPFDPNCLSRKLRCRAGNIIKSIEVIQPDPPDPEPAKEPDPEPAKEPDPEPAKEPDPAPAKEPAHVPIIIEPITIPKQPEPIHLPIIFEPITKQPEPVHVPFIFEPVTVPGYPPKFGVCCGECYHGLSSGPCFHGHGRPQQPCFDGGYERPRSCCDGCERLSQPCYGRKPCYVGYDYFCEENPTSCTTM